MISTIKNAMDHLQNILSCRYFYGPQFMEKKCLGLVGIAGFCLGTVMGIHCGFLLVAAIVKYYLEIYIDHTDTLMYWSVYMILLCYFHIMEFYSVAAFNPRELSYDSFLINHSKGYTAAAMASWIEFWIEAIVFGHKKYNIYLFSIGLLLVICGQSVRSQAMEACGENFSHLIMRTCKTDHKLVTHGIYSIFRHPSYFGWFYWSIGTQLILCNPLCTVAYTWASWRFFSERIPYEEQLLVDFYQERYLVYMQRTVIGIPFISSKSKRFLKHRINLKE